MTATVLAEDEPVYLIVEPTATDTPTNTPTITPTETQTPDPCTLCDLDGNGIPDLKYLLEFIRLRRLYERGDREQSMRADFNKDSVVDSVDLTLFSRAYQMQSPWSLTVLSRC